MQLVLCFLVTDGEVAGEEEAAWLQAVPWIVISSQLSNMPLVYVRLTHVPPRPPPSPQKKKNPPQKTQKTTNHQTTNPNQQPTKKIPPTFLGSANELNIFLKTLYKTILQLHDKEAC